MDGPWTTLRERQDRAPRRWARLVAVTAVVAALQPLVLVTMPRPSAAASCSPTLTEVACENQLAGSPPSEWDLDGATDDSIVGFATQISVQAGETVSFKVRTDARAYSIAIYRLGWYQGNGARRVATIAPSAPLPQSQPPCLTVASTGLIDCGNWSESARWTVPAGSVSGVYLAHLVRPDDGDDSHIVFVVRDDASHSDLVFQTSDTTWQAYNDWGGNSLYKGAPDNRAYKVSYNRPFATRETTPAGRDWVMANEVPMIRWLERNGYDVTYQTGVDTDRSGSLLVNHRAFLSVGHDEYWSGQQRANVEAARAAGVHLAFFSGNEVYWKTRWEPSIDGTGTSHRTLVTYKETRNGAKIDPSPTWTGTWRDPRFSPPSDGGVPENALTGSWYKVQAYNGPIQVPEADGKLRLWRGTSVATQAPGQTASIGGTVLGYEFNETPDNGFQPAGLVRMSTTNVAANEYLTDWGRTVAPGTATHHVTLYRAPSGALVFGAGTIQWTWGLDAQHDGVGVPPADPRIQQATMNVLADMGAQPTTLQAGLVAAAATTDGTGPSVSIASPASGATVTGAQVVTVSGTATDAGGLVGAVEVSVDGGATWKTAVGRSSWTFAWMPTGEAATTVRVRAADDSGNIGPEARVTVDARCPCTLLGNDTPDLPAEPTDTNAVTLGMRFSSEVGGVVTGVRFFKGPGNGGTHIGSLWTASGVRLGQVTFSNESASGWQQATFAAPITIAAGQTYVVSYAAPVGRYAVDRNGFQRAGVDHPPLHAPADGDAGNGVYRYGSNVFPDLSYESENYWVDVVFAPSGSPPGDTTPPTASVVAPAAGATGVATSAAAVVQFSEPVQPSSVQLTLVGPGGPVAGNVSYDPTSRRATFTPSTALTSGSAHTATVAGARDLAGNALVSPLGWTFTTAGAAPPPTCPCTLFAATDAPAVASGDDPFPVTVGTRFRTDVAGVVTGVRFYKGPLNTGTHTGSLWDDAGTRLATATFVGESATGWQQVTFATPVAIVPGRDYVVSTFLPDGGYAYTVEQFATSGVDRGPLHAPADGDGGGNALYVYGSDARPAATWRSTNYWVDVVFSPTGSPCPCSVFGAAEVPAENNVFDTKEVELGMRVRPSVDGVATGIRFYKGTRNTGTHTGSLWTSTGVRLATVTFTNETASGWQQANLSTPVPLTAGTTYVVSYHAPIGRYSRAIDGFATQSRTNGPLTAPAAAPGAPNGVYRNGPSAFPTSTWRSTNYWVDLVFTPT